MKKVEKTTVYVVDFVNKRVLLTETLSNKNSKKEEETLVRIDQAVGLVVQGMQQVKKAS